MQLEPFPGCLARRPPSCALCTIIRRRAAHNTCWCAAGAQATAKVGASTAHTTDTQKEMGTVKAAKAAARHLREAGQRPKEASSAALQAVGVAKRDKQKKSKRPRGDSLDSDDEGGAAKLARLASAPSCVYAGALPTRLRR